MFFGSYLEFIYILVFILIFNGLKWIWPEAMRLRRLILLLGSLLIISTIVSFNTIVVLMVLMTVLMAIGYMIGHQLKEEISYIYINF